MSVEELFTVEEELEAEMILPGKEGLHLLPYKLQGNGQVMLSNGMCRTCAAQPRRPKT